MLPFEDKALFQERLDAIPAGYPGQRVHTATTMASNFSGGMDRPSSFKTARYPSMASLMLTMAVSLVSPPG